MIPEDTDIADDYTFEEDPSLSDVHLWDYVQVVLQRFPLAITVFLSVVVIALIYTVTRTDRYRAVARVLIERGKIDLTNQKGAYDSATGGNQREFMSTQVTLITSRPVMEAVIEKANLLSDPDFKKMRDPVEALSSAVMAIQVRNTDLIDISIERENAGQAATIVNAVVDSFLAENRKRRMGVSEQGLVELQKKAESLREELVISTAALQDFMVDKKIVSFEKAQNITVERLRDLSRAVTRAEPARMALQARVEAADDAIKAGESVDSLPNVVSSGVVRVLKLELARLAQDYSQLVLRLGENHPKLQAISIQMDAVRTKIAMEAATVLTSLRIEYEQAKHEERLLKEALREQEEEVFLFNKLAGEYDLLKQRKMLVERSYNTICRRAGEIDLNRMGGQGDNIFVISRAWTPSQKSWPNRTKNMLVAVMLGSGLAIGLCFFLDYMDTTIKGEPDVRGLLRSTVLAGIPNMMDEVAEGEVPDLVALDKPRSNFAEAFRSLRTALAFSVHGESLRSMVVSSTLPGEGKTIVAVNLAIAQAQISRKTLLVDGDMRKPRLHKIFAVSSDKGVSNLLADSGECNLDDMVMATNIKNLYYLPCGPIPGNPVELLDSERFGKLIAEMESKFDMVVIDSPPGYSLVDSLVIGKHVGGLVLVTRSFVTPKQAARQCVERLRVAGVRLLGVVLNNIDLPGSYYGGAYYDGRYGQYYAEVPGGGTARPRGWLRRAFAFLKKNGARALID